MILQTLLFEPESGHVVVSLSNNRWLKTIHRSPSLYFISQKSSSDHLILYL